MPTHAPSRIGAQRFRAARRTCSAPRALACFALALASCAAAVPASSTSRREPTRARETAFSSSLGAALCLSDELRTWLRFAPDVDHVEYVVQERAPNTEEAWIRSEHSFPAPFVVLHVAARQANELYVAGRDGDADVIEHWKLTEPRGARWFHVAASPHSPIGVPLPPVPRSDSGIVGGAYVPPAERTERYALERTELLRASPAHGVLALLADPEGRFLVVVTDAPRAIRVLHVATRTLSEALAGGLDAELPRFRGATALRHHASNGRLYELGLDALQPSASSDAARHLHDRDNDGRFERWVLLRDADARSAAGYDGAVWTVPDFVELGER